MNKMTHATNTYSLIKAMLESRTGDMKKKQNIIEEKLSNAGYQELKFNISNSFEESDRLYKEAFKKGSIMLWFNFDSSTSGEVKNVYEFDSNIRRKSEQKKWFAWYPFDESNKTEKEQNALVSA